MKLLVITKKPKTKPCPYCGKPISVKAIRCKWCGRWMTKKAFRQNLPEEKQMR